MFFFLLQIPAFPSLNAIKYVLSFFSSILYMSLYSFLSSAFLSESIYPYLIPLFVFKPTIYPLFLYPTASSQYLSLYISSYFGLTTTAPLILIIPYFPDFLTSIKPSLNSNPSIDSYSAFVIFFPLKSIKPYRPFDLYLRTLFS